MFGDGIRDGRHLLLVGDHLAEGGGHLAKLVARSHGNPLIQFADGQLAGGEGDLTDRAGDAARQKKADEQREDGRGAREEERDAPRGVVGCFVVGGDAIGGLALFFQKCINRLVRGCFQAHPVRGVRCECPAAIARVQFLQRGVTPRGVGLPDGLKASERLDILAVRIRLVHLTDQITQLDVRCGYLVAQRGVHRAIIGEQVLQRCRTGIPRLIHVAREQVCAAEHVAIHRSLGVVEAPHRDQGIHTQRSGEQAEAKEAGQQL